MKFTFIGEYQPPELGCRTTEAPSTKVTFEFEADGIEVVLTEFKQFLTGCGYSIDGEIDICGQDDEPARTAG